MKITILHNPKCSKSRFALQEIEENGNTVQVINYLVQTPSIDELKKIVKMLGIKPEELIRKKEPLYTEKFAGKKYTDDQWLKILHKHPILIERPILIKGDIAVIGRSEEQIARILNK